MNSSEKLAMWQVFNALLKANDKPPLLFGNVRAWWDRYESELRMEKAYRQSDDEYRARVAAGDRDARHAWD